MSKRKKLLLFNDEGRRIGQVENDNHGHGPKRFRTLLILLAAIAVGYGLNTAAGRDVVDQGWKVLKGAAPSTPVR